MTEMMLLTRLAQKNLRTAYRAPGIQSRYEHRQFRGRRHRRTYPHACAPPLVGRCQFHDHVGETRVIPEDLEETYRKLSWRFMAPVTVTNARRPGVHRA